MKKLLALICLLCSFLSHVFAQKDAPVAGHAANLVDLLKKDYNAIDPDLRGDEIIKDRALVIAIFKSYFTDDQRAHFSKEIIQLEATSKEMLAAQVAFNKAKRAMSTVSGISPTMAGKEGIDALVKNADSASESVEKVKHDYMTRKCDLDVEELRFISCEYHNENNAFVVHVLDQFILKYRQLKLGTDSYSSSNYTAAITKSLPFVGGELAFEVVADGLSRFLAKRIKEELTTMVVERVKVWLKQGGENDPFAELKVMLPRTVQYLLVFKPEKITSFPDEIKQYIEDDLNHALTNAANLKNTPRIRALIDEHPDLDFAMEAIEMIPNLSKLKNPADYFKTIENSRNLRRWGGHGNTAGQFNIANMVKLSCMIGQSMLMIDNGELRFAGKDFMGAYVGEKNFFLLYVGFLSQQNAKYYDIEFKYKEGSERKNLVLLTELKNLVRQSDSTDLSNERKFFNFMLTGIGDNAEKVLVNATEIRKANKAGKKIGADTVFRFVESMINLSENVVFAGGALIDYLEVGHAEHLARIRQGHSSFDKIAVPYFTVARSINEITFDIQKRKYANALIKSIELKEKLEDGYVKSDADLLARVAQMDYIHTYKTVKHWPATIERIKKRVESGSGDTTLVGLIVRDIKYIDTLATQIYKGKIKPSIFEDLLKPVREMQITNTGVTGDLSRIIPLLNNPDFRQVATAYFTGIFADSIMTFPEMSKLRNRFPQQKETELSKYDSAAIANIKANAVKYAIGLGDVLIKEEPTKELLELRAKLESSVRDYWNSFDSSAAPKPTSNAISLIHFINDIAVAENPEDIEQAIEVFALPAGSYAVKRKAKFNFSINSFPGLLPAYEIPWKSNGDTSGNDPGSSFSIGFTAPVGFSGTWGYYGRSYGFFLTVIDLGAITRLRLDNDKSTVTLPKLTFQNFLSPGFYFHWGLKNKPLSFNIGGQFGPELRRFTSAEKYLTYDSFRFGIGLVLDIPLLNLYTKPRFEEK